MLRPELAYTDAFCQNPFHHVKINTAGEVTMCCYQGGSLGNVLTTPIVDIWNSELAKDIRRVTKEHRLHPCCMEWKGCPFQNAKLEKEKRYSYSPIIPTSVEIDLPSFHCNIGGVTPDDDHPACIMCPRNSKSFRAEPSFGMDNTDRILETVRPLMPYLGSLAVLGVAEPFWKNLIFDLLDKLNFQDFKSNIYFWTVNNGSLFAEKTARRYIDAISRGALMFSVDAGTRETYLKIRRLDFFDTIRRNIKRYNEIRPPYHRIEVFNNVNTLNAHEMILMVEFAKEVGSDLLKLNPTHNCGIDGYANEIMVNKDNLTLFTDHYQQAKERAKALGVSLLLVREFEQCVDP